MWRKNSGITSGATHAQGDANNDGAVNDTDYTIWRTQYGSLPAAGAAFGAVGENSELFASEENSDDTGLDTISRNSYLSLKTGALPQAPRPTVVWSDATTTARDWTSLLNDLAEQKVRHGKLPNNSFSDAAQPANDEPHAMDLGIGCGFIALGRAWE